MIELYDKISEASSKNITKSYSTSFSLGIRFLDEEYHQPIYNIYGFVRLADEIVDTFHQFDKKTLLAEFREETFTSIKRGISTNPVLQSFQKTVNEYNIPNELTETFLNSMEMDLEEIVYDRETYNLYILGSAEVVGLMCLKVFLRGDDQEYERLKPTAMRLGAAFQKINFLRDINADYQNMGRTYFPDVNFEKFSKEDKVTIENEIAEDFSEALKGIKELPRGAKRGVYLAYIYYLKLFEKIKHTPTQQLLSARIRIPNFKKILLLIRTFFSLRLKRI